tara:strand:+ start:537 stop:809 length:273 start_codon:yes stop_codon:yes gene_type:complete
MMNQINISGEDYPLECSDSKGFKVRQWDYDGISVGGIIDINLRLNFGGYFASIDVQAKVVDVDIYQHTMAASYDNVTRLSRDLIEQYFQK